MSLSSLLGIGTAHAAPAAATAATHAGQHHSSPWSMFLLPLLIIVFFYFVLIRPQSKRAKEHKNLLSKVGIGDEVLTAGGMVGKITKLRDNFIVVTVAKGVEITLQKSSVASVLPKGTMDSAD